ncbi:MAG: hypothetical protein HY294_03130 [Candidatus Rokubacteria bacterium]|nr:hypothetical protein [Candidatus Rokubacteria bacterium]
MRVLLISYESKATRPDYGKLTAEIKRSPGWLHVHGHTWMIATEETAAETRARLVIAHGRILPLLVIEVARHFDGLLRRTAWDWVREHVKSRVVALRD